LGQVQLLPDSIEEQDTILETPNLTYSSQIPFINYKNNIVEWMQCDAITHFFSALGNAENRKIRVLHIGDSHVQTDYYTGTLRNTLQEIFGYGGRGFVFPYKSAGTHSAYDYFTNSSGVWEFSRNIQREPKFDMGITGATIHTKDTNATFSIIFRSKYSSIRSDYTKLRIFCKTDSASFGLQLKTGINATPIQVPVYSIANPGYIDINLPFASDSLLFSLYRVDTIQTQFECYGVLIESNSDNGILYSSVGINGAGYKSILKENLFEKQLEVYNPDLVVVDIGANDFYPFNYNEIELETNLKLIISRIRKASPTCKNFSLFTRKMAVQNGCAFYDYFHISGGQFALAQWRKMGLAQPDRVHLTYKGYALKAELMTNALLNSYREYVQNSPNELIANQFFADTTEFEETIPDTLITEIPASKPKSIVSNTARLTNVSYHTVKKGETISVIALRYQISNYDIKLWNNLKTNRLFAGQKLRVAPPMAVSKSIKTADKNTTSKKKTNPPVFHLVKKGETLFSIAKKYKVSIQQLKQLNNLKKETIQPGMRIKIK
jgi:LysM repeat protein